MMAYEKYTEFVLKVIADSPSSITAAHTACTSNRLTSSLIAQSVKNLPARQETRVQFLGQEDPLEKEMATHSSILAWRLPWTEEPGRLESTGSQELEMTEQLNHHIFTFLKGAYHDCMLSVICKSVAILSANFNFLFSILIMGPIHSKLLLYHNFSISELQLYHNFSISLDYPRLIFFQG